MNEIRIDDLTGEAVIIARGRGKRPMDTDYPLSVLLNNHLCPFCKGNEDMTPREIDRIGGENWTVRVVPNKYGALNKENNLAYGYSEVLIESPYHDLSLGNMDISQVESILRMMQRRYNEIYKDTKIKYVQIFKNYKKDAGASLTHSHSQIMAMSFIPKMIQEEIKSVKEYYNKNNKCYYCDLLTKEIEEGLRIVKNHEKFVVLAPYASKYSYETIIIPKLHQSNFGKLKNIKELATVILDIMRKMRNKLKDPPYNLFIHSQNFTNKFYHWHIEIKPRISKQAGLELSTGVFINSVSPEDAAKVLRNY